MKRFILVLLACLLAFPALAEEKEVTVPPGLYQIGVDIPAGEWGIKCGESDYDFIVLKYGKELNEGGASVSLPCPFMGNVYKDGEGKKEEFVNMTLEEGYYLSIELGQAVFCAPIKRDLGF